MAGRTFAVGDIHGDLTALHTLFERLPALTDDDTIVFLGDYIDRGPESAGVIQFVRELADKGPAKVVALRAVAPNAVAIVSATSVRRTRG